MRFVRMKIDVTPSFFYGAAVATAVGLGLGGMLHVSWDTTGRIMGPGILFPTAAAAERLASTGPATPADDGAPAADPDPMVAWGGSVPADPQPLVRLAAARFDAMVAARSAQGRDAALDEQIAQPEDRREGDAPRAETAYAPPDARPLSMAAP